MNAFSHVTVKSFELRLQVFVVLGQGGLLGLLVLGLDLLLPLGVHLDLWGHESGHGDELEVGVADKLSGQPEEGLLEVVIGLGGDVVVLKVLFPMENDGFGFDLSVFNIDFVAGENDGNVLAYSDQISVPVGNVFVCNSRRNVEHDDSALALNIVSVTKTAKLLLTSGIPNVKSDGASIRVENKGMDFYTESGDIFLFEFTG